MPGFTLTMTTPAGSGALLHCTTDGSGPRVFGSGEVSITASEYTGGVVIDDHTVVRARTLEDATWSALEESVFTVSRPGGGQISGDATPDGRLDITDAASVPGVLFLASNGELPYDGATVEEGANRTLLDVSGDGRVNLTAAVWALNYLFRGGPAPASGGDCVAIGGCPDRCRS